MEWIDGTKRDDFNWQRTPLTPDALAGKKMAVIGGTNGIGWAFAHTLAAKGAEVIVVSNLTCRRRNLTRLCEKFAPISFTILRRTRAEYGSLRADSGGFFRQIASRIGIGVASLATKATLVEVEAIARVE